MRIIDLSLYLVTDRGLSKGRSLEYVVEKAVKGGVSIIQLREKNCSTKEFTELAISLKKLLEPLDIPLLINDRLDIALAVNADGVHLGQDDMHCEIARKILGKDKIIGLSIENIEQAEEANSYDIDYIGISPVFLTGTKPEFTIGLGLAGVKKITAISKFPSVAIGGINSGNAGEILKAGATGLAVVSAIMSAADPMLAAVELRKEITKFEKNKG